MGTGSYPPRICLMLHTKLVLEEFSMHQLLLLQWSGQLTLMTKTLLLNFNYNSAIPSLALGVLFGVLLQQTKISITHILMMLLRVAPLTSLDTTRIMMKLMERGLKDI